MRVVVDANALFGALIRDSTNRRIILHGVHDLFVPRWIWDELTRKEAMLLAKAGVPHSAFYLALERIRSNVSMVPQQAIWPHIDAAFAAGVDRKDVPYIAAALAIDGAVWSHDRPLADRAPVPVVTTADLA
jgi:predicted nucleic acid-binding protein